MNKRGYQKTIRLALVVITTLLAGCGPSAKEQQVITDLTMNMQTTCMGRFLIDLPQDMDNRGSVTLYYGLDENFKTVEVSIEELNTTPQKIADSVAEQAAEIAKRTNFETGKSMLLEHRKNSDHAIYLRYQGATEIAATFKRELHLLVGRSHVKLYADSFEGLPYNPNFPKEPGEKVDERLYRLASQIHAYGDPAKAGPGFCLGPVVINSDHDEEQAGFYFPMEDHPDLLFTAYSKALTPYDPNDTLLGRMDSVSSGYAIDILRKGKTILGAMAAQEWLASGANDYGNKVLSFAVESTRPDPGFAHPLMSFSLDTGGQLRDGSGTYVNSSLTPREGVALWDAIIKSVRPRADAVKPDTAGTPAS